MVQLKLFLAALLLSSIGLLVGAGINASENAVDAKLRLKFTSGIRSIFEDSKGNFWFGSHEEGVALFDGEKFTYFSLVDGLSDNQVRAIQEDQNGDIWFETGGGLSSYDGEKMIVHTWKDYLSKNDWQSRAGDLWFKGDEGIGVNELEGQPGIYRYDGKNLIYLAFPLPESDYGNNYYSVSTGTVQGKSGKLWFGTYGAVIGYDGQSFTFIDNDSLGLNEESGFLHVRSILEDKDGNLWIGNNGIGVLFRDGVSTINFTEKHGLGKSETDDKSASLDRIFSIGEDREGNIWFGTVEYGVWRYDGKSLTNFAAKEGLASEHVWTIYKDKRGDLWAGGDSPSGVFKFNGKSFDRVY